jgi:hypothetical protein
MKSLKKRIDSVRFVQCTDMQVILDKKMSFKTQDDCLFPYYWPVIIGIMDNIHNSFSFNLEREVFKITHEE